MSRCSLITLSSLALAVVSVVAAPTSSKLAPPTGGKKAMANPQTMPKLARSLDFEPNRGQSDPRVRYIGRGRGSIVFITDEGAVLATGHLPSGNELRDGMGAFVPDKAHLDVQTIRMSMVDAGKPTDFRASEARRGTVSYYKGNDRSKWLSGVPLFGRVNAKSVYPGVDIAYYGTEGQLEYDFVVAPGADPNRIHLAFTGQDSMRVDGNGDLILATSQGDFIQRRPKVYQDMGGRRVEVAASYRIDGGNVAFALAQYDNRKPLVIDPVLISSTYLGGSGYDAINGMSPTSYRNSAGFVVVAGLTFSADFPGYLNTSYKGNADAFVAIINPDTGTLDQAVYLGGSGLDFATSVSVDPNSDNLCVGGLTGSSDFPISFQAYQSTGPATGDSIGFVTCWGNSNFVYNNTLNLTSPPFLSTYIGLYHAGVNSVAFSTSSVDPSERTLYIGGYAQRGELTLNTIVQCLNTVNCEGQHTDRDGFFGYVQTYYVQFDQVELIQVGGSGDDSVNAVSGGGDFGGASDSGGIVAIGVTQSHDLFQKNSVRGALVSNQNCMVAVFDNPSKDAAMVSYYGGSNGGDTCVAVKAFAPSSGYNATFVFGGNTTASAFFGTGGAISTTNAGGEDVFLAEMQTSTNSASILYSTLFGGSGDDSINSIAWDGPGQPIFAAGSTSSPNLPTADPLPGHSTLQGTSDGLILVVTPGSSPSVASYFGGAGVDNITGIAKFDQSGYFFVAGLTTSLNFPAGVNGTASGAYQQLPPGGGADGFVSKILLNDSTAVSVVSADSITAATFTGIPLDVFIDSNCTTQLTPPYTTEFDATCGLNPTGQISVAIASHYDDPSGWSADFVNWDDGNTSNDRAINAGLAPTTVRTAYYNRKFRLNIATAGTGTGKATPASGSFYSSQAAVAITATPDPGSVFVNWTGASNMFAIDDPTSASTMIHLFAPESITANFAPAPKTNPVITWANPADIVYGTALGATQLNATANVAGTFVYTPAAGTVLKAGAAQTLSVQFNPTNTALYASVSATVMINVSKATPTITWANPADIVVGTALSATQLNATANVPGTFAYNPIAGTVLASGPNQTLSVTFTPTDSVDYNQAMKSVSIKVVAKTNPVITWANPADIVYGTALGATQLNATANVPGTFVYTPAAGTVLKAGAAQTLSVQFNPTDTSKYVSVTSNVKINVGKVNPTITWTNPADIAAGTALGATQLNATANVPGTFAYTPTAGTVLAAGPNQTLAVLFTPTDSADYNTATKSVSINVVGKANPVITWANPASIVFGSALSSVQLNATANVPGTFVYNPPAGTVLLPGANQMLQATFTPTNTNSYNVVSANVTITVSHATVPGIVVTTMLSRDSKTNEIVIQLTLANTGDTALSNVLISSATLTDPIKPLGPTQTTTTRPIVVGTMPGDSVAVRTLRYPAAAGTANEAELLKLQGTYTGGSFNTSSKVIMP